MHLLVLGANGLLGSNVVAAARNQDVAVTGTYHSSAPSFDIPLRQLDITDTAKVRRVITEVDSDWVINCVAMIEVDGCEESTTRAHAVNADAPGEIASVCASNGMELLHVSTDYVFDGTATEKYSEDATTNPIQVYGESKLAGERAVRDAASDALIPRLSFVYGIHRSGGKLTGFPAWVRDRLLEGEETPLFTDQYVTPTRAGAAAETFLEFIDRNSGGIYHLAARSCVTPYVFGESIAQRMDADLDLLVPGSQTDVDRPAERPSYTCLDVERIEDELGHTQPTLDQDLNEIWDAFESC